MNSQTSRKTNEMPDCTKRRLRVQKTSPVWNETKTYKMTFPPFFSGNSSHFGCRRIAQVISSEELGTMSKNNLRRITLVRGPIWGIHSLTLIISCHNVLIRMPKQFDSDFPSQCFDVSITLNFTSGKVQNRETKNRRLVWLWRHFRTSSFALKQISQSFSYFPINNALLHYSVLGKFISSQ